MEKESESESERKREHKRGTKGRQKREIENLGTR